MKRAIALLTILSCFLHIAAQNTIGLPEIINYSKQAYKAGTQNWDICQDKAGILYFANNEGVLSFDGTYWKLYPLPNKTIARSVGIAYDDKLYVGAQDEIGYFAPNKQGVLEYQSLKQLIPEKNRSFADVWDVVCVGKQVFFRSNNQILQLAGDRITVYPATNWLYMGATPDIFIAQDFDKGILRFDKDVWMPLVPKEQLPEGLLITAVVRGGRDSTLLTTLKHGIYLYTRNQLKPFTSPSLSVIANCNIYGAATIDEEHVALATTQKGCIVIDKQGNQVQLFSRHEGLQNNNVLSIYPDRNKNLWLGLDHGIDFIAYNSAIKNIYPDKENDGSGYSSIVHNNRLYIATTNGLYQVPLYNIPDLSFVKGSFTPVHGARGQVWNLSEVNGKLLMGHHEGFWEVKDNTATPFDHSTGFWTFLPLNAILPSPIMVAGTYDGIRFYDYKAGKFLKEYKEARFESARFVAINNNDIWVSHPYKGIYRVRLPENEPPTVENYGVKQGINLTANGNYVFKVKNRIVVTTEKGIYEYNPQTDHFEPSDYFNSFFGKTVIRYLKEDGAGNIWFIFDKTLGIVDFSEQKPQVIYIPELNRKMVSGLEQVYPIDANNIFVGSERGFFHINYAKYRQQHPAIQVQVRQVKASNKTDSLLFGGYFANVNEPQLQQQRSSVSYDWNSFRFEFAAPLYEQQSNIEYSYYLKGYDNDWSDWNNKTEKEYSYLPAGHYQFEVKARNNLGNESAVYTYSFVILPPWYQTWWAYTLYGCALQYAAYALYRWQKQKFQRQRLRYEEKQKRLHDLHQLELEKNEKEIVKLRNEKLEAEIQHKNKEMASATMHLVKKGELITRLRDELQKLMKNSEDDKSLEALKKMVKTLGEEDKMDADWEHFTIHFDKAHNDFFVALKEKHNNLTPNELKLCAYLRMNLSTKEMAQLMNISVRGVEISRYRLRKKLQISTETNLFTYLLDFHGNGKEFDDLKI
ncbi:MAG: ligand-binding sensor domain-containing protein [Agriterribacter sp.]